MEKNQTFFNKRPGRDQTPKQREAAIRNHIHMRLAGIITTLRYTTDSGWLTDKEFQDAINICATAIARIKVNKKT